MTEIAVVGTGAFGTSLALALAREGKNVVLWGRDDSAIGAMQQSRMTGDKLPGYALPAGLSVTSSLSDAARAGIVLLAIPMQALSGFLSENAAVLDGRDLVACCKGIDLVRGQGPTGIIREACPSSVVAVLSGPSFAVDIADGLPTALTLACDDARAEGIQSTLSTGQLRLYLTDDVIGTELSGALKNVVALAAGMTMGAQLGESARAAVVARGFAEMTRYAESAGARRETLTGLAGLGDLFLTCGSEKSRNYRAGLSFGRGEALPSGTVEGIATARAALSVARETGLSMPLTEQVVAVTEGRISIAEAMTNLFARPLKRENQE